MTSHLWNICLFSLSPSVAERKEFAAINSVSKGQTALEFLKTNLIQALASAEPDAFQSFNSWNLTNLCI